MNLFGRFFLAFCVFSCFFVRRNCVIGIFQIREETFRMSMREDISVLLGYNCLFVITYLCVLICDFFFN